MRRKQNVENILLGGKSRNHFLTRSKHDKFFSRPIDGCVGIEFEFSQNRAVFTFGFRAYYYA